MITFMIDERPHHFWQDELANRRFLEGIDPQYWAYQASVHTECLAGEDSEGRQRAAAGLRIAYGQGLETLFAFLAAAIQAPAYPLGWIYRYSNADLDRVIQKVHTKASLSSSLTTGASWSPVSAFVFSGFTELHRARLTGQFATLWGLLADDFLDDRSKAEYNSLKHGMRAEFGGFNLALEVWSPTAPPSQLHRVEAKSEFGSALWMRPEKIAETKFACLALKDNVRSAWFPEQFAARLVLIGMSVRNVVSRLLIQSGLDPRETSWAWPAEEKAFDEPWEKQHSIQYLTQTYSKFDLRDWQEPSLEKIRQTYGPAPDCNDTEET